MWPFGQTHLIIVRKVAMLSIFTDYVLKIPKYASNGYCKVWSKFGQTQSIIGRKVALSSNFTVRVSKIARYVSEGDAEVWPKFSQTN